LDPSVHELLRGPLVPDIGLRPRGRRLLYLRAFRPGTPAPYPELVATHRRVCDHDQQPAGHSAGLWSRAYRWSRDLCRVDIQWGPSGSDCRLAVTARSQPRAVGLAHASWGYRDPGHHLVWRC